MNITVYTICYNEKIMLPYFFEHYKKIANKIVVYDNDSKDGSQDLITQLGGELRHFSTNGLQDNIAMLNVKNNCWKGDKSDWVIVCDMDEFLIDTHKLQNYSGNIVFKPEGYNMWGNIDVNIPNNPDFWKINKGDSAPQFGKMICFSPAINEINYSPGAHTARPIGANIVNDMRLLHYLWLSEDYVVNKYNKYIPRFSENDKLNRFGIHYLQGEVATREQYRNTEKHCYDIPNL